MQSHETAGEAEQSESTQSANEEVETDQKYWAEFEQLVNQRVLMAQEGIAPQPAPSAWEHSYDTMADIVVAQFMLYASIRRVEETVYQNFNQQEESE